MQQPGNTKLVVDRLKDGLGVTTILQSAKGQSLGDYLFDFLSKLDCSVEVVAGLAGLNKSSLYRILNGEVSPQRNVLLRLSRILCMNFEQTQQLLKLGRQAGLTANDPRDIVIIGGIIHGLDIADINDDLERKGFGDLFGKK